MIVPTGSSAKGSPDTFRFVHGLGNQYNSRNRAFVLRNHQKTSKTLAIAKKCPRCGRPQTIHRKGQNVSGTVSPSNTSECVCNPSQQVEAMPAISLLSAGRNDPFGTLPRILTSREQYLLDYCKSSVNSKHGFCLVKDLEPHCGIR